MRGAARSPELRAHRQAMGGGTCSTGCAHVSASVRPTTEPIFATPNGEGRGAVLAERRTIAARTLPGPTLAVRGVPPSHGPLDGKALHVFVGLRRIERLAHHNETLRRGRRRGEADLLHQLRRV